MPSDIETALDFDGTITDVEREAIPFIDAYRRAIAEHLGLTPNEFGRVWNQVQKTVQSAPGEYGWRDPAMQKIVAPATSEPLLLTRATAEELFTNLLQNPQGLGIDPSPTLQKSLPQDPFELDQFLTRLFSKHHHKMETHFRPDAAEFLKALAALGGLTIVTNTRTTTVEGKLASLREQDSSVPKIRVQGDAKKYVLVPDFVIEGVAAKLDCSPHLLRKVFTQRGEYYKVLRDIGVLEAKSGVVAGDVWELDLMLPLLLGMKAAFITRAMTPLHEKAIVQKQVEQGRAKMVSSLEELYFALEELHQV